MKQQISELFIKHSVHTNQALINDLVSLVEARDKEIAQMIEGMPAMTLTNPGNNHPANAYKLIDKRDLLTKLEQQK